MSAPRLLIDNDILILLSCSGLLDDAINALGFDKPSAFHLGTLPFIMRTDPSLQQLSEHQKNLIRNTCQELSVIVDQPSIATEKSLAQIRNIHEGEAVLYGLAADHPTYLITSGDKEAMRTLASEPTLRDIRQALAGRVICLETLCLEIIRTRDTFYVASAFTPLIPQHNSLKIYFGAIDIIGETGCHAAIEHYLAILNEQLGDDFLWAR